MAELCFMERRAERNSRTRCNRPEVQEMIGRVDFGVNPVAEAAGYNKMTTIVDQAQRR